MVTSRVRKSKMQAVKLAIARESRFDAEEFLRSIPDEVRSQAWNGLAECDVERAATAALAMAKTIRDLLPIKKRQINATEFFAIEAAHKLAALWYTEFERVRNPLGFPWPGPRGSFSFSAIRWPAVAYYMNLCVLMESVCLTYGWEGLSGLAWLDGRPSPKQRPHCRVRDGIPVPAIAPDLLDAVERTARGLMEQLGTTEPSGRWSEPASPAMWAKWFRMSWDTLKVLIDTGKIRADKCSSKMYRIHLEDLPPSYRAANRNSK
jgi:hypothetical protein